MRYFCTALVQFAEPGVRGERAGMCAGGGQRRKRACAGGGRWVADSEWRAASGGPCALRARGAALAGRGRGRRVAGAGGARVAAGVRGTGGRERWHDQRMQAPRRRRCSVLPRTPSFVHARPWGGHAREGLGLPPMNAATAAATIVALVVAAVVALVAEAVVALEGQLFPVVVGRKGSVDARDRRVCGCRQRRKIHPVELVGASKVSRTYRELGTLPVRRLGNFDGKLAAAVWASVSGGHN
ncbi:hypothetical protein GGX14DRAFT_638081 [Mycena pura]|uniref:Uncharacterized protein n=1 Tax=Mycena pura TaxID=153505 RepID=A0AAD7E364_9AGAR|nr:hypothetical protein GGX14DRAFT_638081 [Mycena pura]